MASNKTNENKIKRKTTKKVTTKNNVTRKTTAKNHTSGTKKRIPKGRRNSDEQ